MGQRGYVTLVTWLLSIPMTVLSGESGWRPLKSKPDFVIGPKPFYGSHPRKLPPLLNACSLYKAVMDQRTFHQYVQYKHRIPDMKEFTLCAWHKFYNHSVDHPIFSYAVPHKPRTILSWIANTPKKSYCMLAINGHTIYRVNYPMKLHKWYHTCQSWNGKTGEWQLWVNDERVNRGYYNLLVGKPIKGGGIAISGQEQREYGGGFNLKGRGEGLQGEITLLQLYKAALSKGKAYSDHKHHHVHNFNHDGSYGDDEDTSEASPTMAPEMPEMPTSEHPFLENGQLKHRLPVHELLARGAPKPMHNLELLTMFERFHPSSVLKIEKPMTDPAFNQDYKFFKRNGEKISTNGVSNSRNKRHNNATNIRIPLNSQNRRYRKNPAQYNDVRHVADSMLRKHISEKYENKMKQYNNRRALIMNEHFPSSMDFPADQGFPGFFSELDGHNVLQDDTSAFFKNTIPDHEEKKIEYEPAEWEVRKISSVCSACEDDPFHKANVLSWQETPKKLFAGAEYVLAVPKCHIF